MPEQRDSPCQMVSPQYLAGFVDGEGHLGIERIANTSFRSHYHSTEHVVRVHVANTNLEVLQAIQRDYGGSLVAMKAPNRPRNRQAWKLIWNSRKAEKLLRIVGPHLIVKRPQYLLILEFLATRQKNKRVGGSNGRLDPSEIAVRDGFHGRLKQLNHRGVRSGSTRSEHDHVGANLNP